MSPDALRRDLVLVVDDAPDTLSFLTDALDAIGVTVLVATDGAAALELTQEITPDLILMDALMPGIDGFETCRRMKEDPALRQVPVIFMTGLSETEHVLQGLEAGGVDYVTKPIVVEELLARIRVHLTNARAAQMSQRALDASGRYLMSTDDDGRLLWATPRAEQLLRELFDNDAGCELPPETSAWLRDLRVGLHSGALSRGGQRLQFTYVSSVEAQEHLYRIVRQQADAEAQAREEAERLRASLPLTQREAEVLLWLSRGMSNRDISEVLGISPRTVNKHLEQIFSKLGVDKRAAASARASAVLASWN